MGKVKPAVEVAIVVGGEERFLRPTLRAAIAVNRRFDGFVGALRKVHDLDLEAITQIIAAGLDKRDPDDLTDLREQLFAHGVALLVEPTSRFVEVLSYGGRDPGDPPDEERSGSKKA